MFGLILAAAALGLSNFGAAIAIGFSGVDARLRWRVADVFGAFEATTPRIGLLLGRHIASSFGAASAYIGGGLLVATGTYTVVQARQTRDSTSEPAAMHLDQLIVTGAALSIDNLVVGFALGTRSVQLVFAGVVIAVVSVSMSLVGLEVGNRLGVMTQRWSEEFGAFVLIVVGLAVAAKII